MAKLDIEKLEDAKDKVDFDRCVAKHIVGIHDRKYSISIEDLVKEIRQGFNFDKMLKLAGEDRPSLSPPVAGRANKFLDFKRHDDLETFARNVMKVYQNITQQSGSDKKAIRSGTIKIIVTLEEVVRTIPLYKVVKYNISKKK